MRIRRNEVVPIAKETVREFQDDQVTDLAAATAFRLILALPPLVIFFASLSAVVARYTGLDAFGWIREQIQNAPIPDSVQGTIQIVLDTISEQGTTGLLSVGIVLALWAGSGAIDTMIKMFNGAYDVTEGRSMVKRRAIALGLTIGLSVLTITAFILFVFGTRLGQWVAEQAGLGSAFSLVWNIGRWPLIVVFIAFALAILYWAGPSIEHTFRWISPGAIFATLAWLVATWGFSLYLRFADVGSAYGAMGTLIVLLFFLYITSIVLLTGAELNAVIDKRYDPAVVRSKASQPERQSDPEESVRRAEEMAAREGKSPDEFGVTEEVRRRLERKEPV